MKRILALVLCGLTAAAAMAGQEAPAQAVGTFYNVDKEVRIEGAVREIRFEPRYKDRTPFLILVLQDPKSGQTFNVEVSPSWFFRQDLHQGERLTVVGSLAGEGAVIARQLRLRGETLIVRDKKGFPSWSRGAAKAKGKRGVGGL
jgi:hypothetical protein